jgi:hypothetical protein
MKTPSTLRVTALSVATFAALSGAQTAHAQSIWDVLKAKAPGLASVMQAVIVNNSQAPTVVVQPQASAATQVPAAAATPAPQASPVATTAPSPAAAASTGAQPSPAAQAGNGLKKGFEAMTNRRPAEASELPKHAKANSGVVGQLDAGVMSAKEVSLTLPDGSVITGRLQRVASDGRNNAQSWIGTFDDSPGSILVISKARGTITGFGTYKDNVLEIIPAASGKHVLYSVDSSKLPSSEHRPSKIAAGGLVNEGTDYGTGGAVAGAGNGVIQDVLVVYTAASATRHGAATLESMIQSAVQASNQAYMDSGVGITLNLVGTQQVALTEKGSMESTLSAATSDSEIKGIRDRLAADIVMVVSQDSNWCGYAWIMGYNSTGFAPNAYGAMNSGCLSNNTFVHEIGHIQGLDHDRESSAGGGAYAYAYGYRRCTSDGTGFREIMAYPCSGVPLVWKFSSPNLYYNGYAMGVSYEASPSTSAEAVRTLNNTAATVAAFRGASSSGGSSAPSAPTALAASGITYSQVSLTWVDNATNETGFKVERSGDGVIFSEIAALGADTVKYTDATVARLTTYYYRVRAYNSIGASAYTSAVGVSTPDAPPPPPATPSNVAARDDGNGTATVSWSAVTNAANYEVRRETWDSRKQVWGRAATVAKVSASMTSIVDSSGSGVYRYSVKASNAGGGSGYGGPAQVTVTGGNANGRKPR